MGKIWLKSPDPDGNCCGCENKTGPCDPCSPGCLFLPNNDFIFQQYYENKSEAELALLNYSASCIALLRSDFDFQAISNFSASFTNQVLTISAIGAPGFVYAGISIPNDTILENTVITDRSVSFSAVLMTCGAFYNIPWTWGEPVNGDKTFTSPPLPAGQYLVSFILPTASNGSSNYPWQFSLKANKNFNVSTAFAYYKNPDDPSNPNTVSCSVLP